MTIEFTSHVVPNSSAILLMICASSSRKPAPRKKNCQRRELTMAPVWRMNVQHRRMITRERIITEPGNPGSC